jgi:hypothetical protein
MLFTTTATTTAKECGVIKRQRKFSGASLCQTLVFGYLGTPTASLSKLSQAATVCTVQVSRQGMDQRLSDEAGERLAVWLQGLVEHAVQAIITAHPATIPVLTRFAGVYVEDSSQVQFPDALREQWSGCGGTEGTSGAAVKLSVRLNLGTSELQGPVLAAGRLHDRVLATAHPPLPAESLYLVDLGYFSLKRFGELAAARVFYLSRLLAGTKIVDADGKAWDAVTFLEAQGTHTVDVAVRVGQRAQLSCRMLAIRVPEAVAAERRRKMRAAAQREGRTPSKTTLALAAWTVMITNVPPDHLTLAEALVLLRARWQIELLWKCWKSGGGLAISRSAKPEHILCEFYAKLLAMIVQQWVLLVMGHTPPDGSMVVATAAIRASARVLATAVWTGRGLRAALTFIRHSIPDNTRVASRRLRPSTAQLLRNPHLVF